MSPVAPLPRRRLFRRGELIPLIACSAICVVGAGFWLVGLWMYANHDGIQLLERPAVTDAAGAGCSDVTAAIEAAGTDRLDRIAAGDAAIGHLVDRMTALGPDVLAKDHPAKAWIADWQTLVAAREDFAAELTASAATPTFAVPLTEDGYPITGRMIYAASWESCTTAITLAATP